MCTYLDFLLGQGHARDEVETRLLVRLAVGAVGVLENHFVMGTAGCQQLNRQRKAWYEGAYPVLLRLARGCFSAGVVADVSWSSLCWDEAVERKDEGPSRSLGCWEGVTTGSGDEVPWACVCVCVEGVGWVGAWW